MLQPTGVAQAGGKGAIEKESNFFGGEVPTQLSARPIDQEGGGEVGAFHGHGHAVAGDGRDHGEGVAEAKTRVGGGFFGGERKCGDGAERGIIPDGIF